VGKGNTTYVFRKDSLATRRRKRVFDNNNPMRQPLYSLKEVSEKLKVSPTTIRRWARKGKLKGGFKLGNKIMWTESSLLDFMGSNTYEQ